MGSNIDPKNDYAFKYVFANEKRKNILIHLINAVLQPKPGHEVQSVEIRNPFTEKNAIDDKFSILDIRATDQSGREFIIEMQMTIAVHLPNRLLYYFSKIFSSQLKPGEDYDQLRPVICICFLDGVLFPQIADYHLYFQLLERQRHIPLTNQIEFHFFQLDYFRKSESELNDKVEKWIYFFNNAMKMDVSELPKSLDEAEYAEAIGALAMLDQNELDRELYEARERAKRDRLSWENAFKRKNLEVEQMRKQFEEEAKLREQEAKLREQEAKLREQEAAENRANLISHIQLCEQILQQPLTEDKELNKSSTSDLKRLAENLRKKVLDFTKKKD